MRYFDIDIRFCFGRVSVCVCVCMFAIQLNWCDKMMLVLIKGKVELEIPFVMTTMSTKTTNENQDNK